VANPANILYDPSDRCASDALRQDALPTTHWALTSPRFPKSRAAHLLQTTQRVGHPRRCLSIRHPPCEDSSARKQRLGHISKQGSSLLRFLLVEAAQAAARCHPDWRRRYIHLAMRRHRSIAKVAKGRRLAIRLYWMWRNGCEYSQSLEFGSYAGQLGTGHGVK
jgi:hypothetical protein